MSKRLELRVAVDEDAGSRELVLNGRNAWALNELIEAGPSGCTPICSPGPRWSGYVHNLRHDFGLSILTVWEDHGGPFAGRHARYVLLSRVRIVRHSAAA